jgi:hypothetical protein
MEPAGRQVTVFETAAHGSDPFGHAGQPESTVGRRWRPGGAGGAVVGDLDDEAFGGGSQRDDDVAGVAVPHDVGECFLHHPVRGERGGARHLGGVVVVVESYLDARCPYRIGEFGDAF